MKYKLIATLMTMAFVTPAFAEDAVCYNCPPQWADWASMLEAIDKEIKSILSMHRSNFIEIKGNTKERIDKIKETIFS